MAPRRASIGSDDAPGAGKIMNLNSSRSLHLLRLATASPNASFRAGQEEAIKHVVEGRSRLLVVQKTGWGKSLVYFIATDFCAMLALVQPSLSHRCSL